MSAGGGDGASALKRSGGRVAHGDTGAQGMRLRWSVEEAL
jgi:hypothetical protein